jgi:hypothetical protein
MSSISNVSATPISQLTSEIAQIDGSISNKKPIAGDIAGSIAPATQESLQDAQARDFEALAAAIPLGNNKS